MIKGVQFSILSAAEIKRQSVVDFSDQATKVNSKALSNNQLGVVNSHTKCFTCRGTNGECTGHWGSIDLPYPIPNPFLVDWIKKVAQCFCMKCSSLLLPKEQIELHDLNQDFNVLYTEIKALTLKTVSCQKCGEIATEIIKDDDDNFKQRWLIGKTKKTNDLSYQRIFETFKNISAEDFYFIGFNKELLPDKKYKFTIDGLRSHRHEVRPEDFFISVLPVMPLTIRAQTMQGSETKQDDATTLYQEILKSVKQYKTAKTKADQKLCFIKLKTKVYALFKQPKASMQMQKQYNSIQQRLCGKGGHFRSAVESKRTNFGGRSVIGNAPYLPLSCVEVPQEMTIITQQETICNVNVDKWNQVLKNDQKNRQTMIKYRHATAAENVNKGRIISRPTNRISYDGKVVKKNGQTIYEPIIQYVIRNGRKKSVKKVKILILGDVIYRRLQNNDTVILNRQPTIRKEGYSGVDVRVCNVPSKRTITFSLAQCSGLNADQPKLY